METEAKPDIYEAHKAAKEREAKRLEQAKREEREMKNAFMAVAKTAQGQKVLTYIMTMCGFKESSLVGDPVKGLIQDRGTLYNEARRNVYIELRKLIPVTYLNIIEAEKEPVNEQE